MCLLQKKKQSFFTSTALGVIVGLLIVGSSVSQAQEKPPALSAAVRAALGMTSKEDPPSDVSASAIDLSNVPPMINSVEGELELQRRAEEVAAQAAAEQERMEREFNESSFKRASQGLLPLTTEQVRQFMERLEGTQSAAMPPSIGVPKGEIRVVGISLDPGETPPKINLAAGYVTTGSLVIKLVSHGLSWM